MWMISRRVPEIPNPDQGEKGRTGGGALEGDRPREMIYQKTESVINRRDADERRRHDRAVDAGPLPGREPVRDRPRGARVNWRGEQTERRPHDEQSDYSRRER